MEGAIDCWVNVDNGESEPPAWLVRVKEDYFHGGDDFLASLSVDETLAAMDEAGVARAIVNVDAERPLERVLRFAEEHPDRFALSATVDPRRLMHAVRALDSLARTQRVACARIVPFSIDVAPGEPCYYPIYAKCVELGLPLTINTGLPGPPMPGECQHPIHLDRVCIDFPDLSLCMAHGADPWWGVALRLMLKYRNLHLMTSAYAPKYFPEELVYFMNTRGKDKIIFASDHPVLSMRRCVEEAKALDLRPGVLERFLYENAERVFFAHLDSEAS